MKAIVIERFGDPDVLDWRPVPDPVPGPHELLIRVSAAGVNRADCLQRLGLYPAPPGAPAEIPGLEYAGEVVAAGADAPAAAIGRRAMGILAGGGYAELVAVDHRLVLPVPERLDWSEAGAVPEAFLTAWDALVEQSGLRAGQAVLIGAAASGVGSAALQLVRAAGATPIGGSRSAARRERLVELGAAATFDPADSERAAAAIREATGGRGVDIVLDLVGAPAWPLYERCLVERGRVVVVGLLGGHRLELDLTRLLAGRWRVRGTTLRSRPLHEKIELCERARAGLLPLLERGAVGPVVDRTLPLARAADAHRAMHAGEHVGKIVLRADR